MIAISTTIPYGYYEDDNGKRHDLLFTTKDVSVVCATSRHLILRLQMPWMHCLIIAGYAPHSGHSAEDIDHWWTSLAAAIPAKLPSWPIVLLVDANAKLGEDTCEAIGAHGAERGGDKALPFTSFVREHGLWQPSTFPCHFGPTGTWRHPSGSWHRNDYIGLSTFWPITNCKSWVSDDIDVSLHREFNEDHKAALVRLQMPIRHAAMRKLQPLAKAQVEQADLSGLRHSPTVSPHIDIHAHAQLLQEQVLDCLPRQRALGPRKLKSTLSDQTWTLVQRKRAWRQTLREAL